MSTIIASDEKGCSVMPTIKSSKSQYRVFRNVRHELIHLDVRALMDRG